jgi:hypothetical protein
VSWGLSALILVRELTGSLCSSRSGERELILLNAQNREAEGKGARQQKPMLMSSTGVANVQAALKRQREKANSCSPSSPMGKAYSKG